MLCVARCVLRTPYWVVRGAGLSCFIRKERAGWRPVSAVGGESTPTLGTCPGLGPPGTFHGGDPLTTDGTLDGPRVASRFRAMPKRQLWRRAMTRPRHQSVSMMR